MTAVAKTWILGPLSLLRGHPLDAARPSGRLPAVVKHHQEQEAHHSCRVQYDTKFFNVVEDAYEAQGGLVGAADEQAFPISCETCAGSSDCLNFMNRRQVRCEGEPKGITVGSQGGGGGGGGGCFPLPLKSYVCQHYPVTR